MVRSKLKELDPNIVQDAATLYKYYYMPKTMLASLIKSGKIKGITSEDGDSYAKPNDIFKWIDAMDFATTGDVSKLLKEKYKLNVSRQTIGQKVTSKEIEGFRYGPKGGRIVVTPHGEQQILKMFAKNSTESVVKEKPSVKTTEKTDLSKFLGEVSASYSAVLNEQERLRHRLTKLESLVEQVIKTQISMQNTLSALSVKFDQAINANNRPAVPTTIIRRPSNVINTAESSENPKP